MKLDIKEEILHNHLFNASHNFYVSPTASSCYSASHPSLGNQSSPVTLLIPNKTHLCVVKRPKVDVCMGEGRLQLHGQLVTLSGVKREGKGSPSRGQYTLEHMRRKFSLLFAMLLLDTHSLTHSPTHSLTHTHAHTRTYRHTHIHTHKHIHTDIHSRFASLVTAYFVTIIYVIVYIYLPVIFSVIYLHFSC